MAQNALELYKRIKSDPELNAIAQKNNALEYNQPIKYFDNGMSVNQNYANNYLPVENSYEPDLNLETIDPRLFPFLR